MTTSVEPLSILRMRADHESAMTSGQVYLNLTPDFQRPYEAWDEKLQTRLIETVLLGRAMNPIWVVTNEEEECEDVLDGMHRLKTLIRFINNEIEIGGSLTMLDKDVYKGKRFRGLSMDDQQKIRTYSLSINRLDSTYRSDPVKLRDMWEILNHSSKPLNDHELKRPVYLTIQDFFKGYVGEFLETPMYKKAVSKRGGLEDEIMKWVALSQKTIETFNSLPDLRNRWLTRMFGDTRESVEKQFTMVKDDLHKTTMRIKKYSEIIAEGLELTEKPLTRNQEIPFQILVVRSVALIDTDARLRREMPALKALFLKILSEEVGKRNAQYQRYIIDESDNAIHMVLGSKPEPRKFSVEMIAAKLVEQGGKCAICKKMITDKQKYEGDHILPWTAGGKTEPSNLQILHVRCHKKKESILVMSGGGGCGLESEDDGKIKHS